MPSPKFQDHNVTGPADWSVKFTVTGAQLVVILEEKFAVTSQFTSSGQIFK
ncbi:MAG: hypothetical protein ONB46_03550 [candidate division KSB1 bacterium]|nr:hypothetical protein [candidate division KSB1 bacterium]MDZ7365005.1 hypothetical protein [candidate division KSB1 bacterium]MDZ7403400.1 hypothetical protein [candidate division KSB1 bacterium]